MVSPPKSALHVLNSNVCVMQTWGKNPQTFFLGGKFRMLNFSVDSQFFHSMGIDLFVKPPVMWRCCYTRDAKPPVALGQPEVMM